MGVAILKLKDVVDQVGYGMRFDRFYFDLFIRNECVNEYVCDTEEYHLGVFWSFTSQELQLFWHSGKYVQHVDINRVSFYLCNSLHIFCLQFHDFLWKESKLPPRYHKSRDYCSINILTKLLSSCQFDIHIRYLYLLLTFFIVPYLKNLWLGF